MRTVSIVELVAVTGTITEESKQWSSAVNISARFLAQISPKV